MPAPTVDELVQLETEVWSALVAGDPEADARMLAEDFLGVYPSGFADREGHVEQVAAGPSVASFELTEPRTLVVADGAVMLAYRAAFRPATPTGPGEPRAMYVSSLWCLRDDRWINVFSQDTPAP